MSESMSLLELSSVCVVDGRGKIVKEAKVASEPSSHLSNTRKAGTKGALCHGKSKRNPWFAIDCTLSHLLLMLLSPTATEMVQCGHGKRELMYANCNDWHLAKSALFRGRVSPILVTRRHALTTKSGRGPHLRARLR
jgi:hypothetical protein